MSKRGIYKSLLTTLFNSWYLVRIWLLNSNKLRRSEGKLAHWKSYTSLSWLTLITSLTLSNFKSMKVWLGICASVTIDLLLLVNIKGFSCNRFTLPPPINVCYSWVEMCHEPRISLLWTMFILPSVFRCILLVYLRDRCIFVRNEGVVYSDSCV